MFTIKDLKEQEDHLQKALNLAHQQNYREVQQIGDMLNQMGYSICAGILAHSALRHKILVELSS